MVDPATTQRRLGAHHHLHRRASRADYFGGYRADHRLVGPRSTSTMAEPLVTRNYGGLAGRRLGCRRVRPHVDHRRPLVLTSTPRTTRSRPASPSTRSGTLVDTDQISQEFRVNGDLEPTASTTRPVCTSSGSKPSTTSRNLYGADAGAFFASERAVPDAQHARRPDRCCSSRWPDIFATNTQNPVSNSEAVFGQANWQVTDRPTLTAGLRYTWEHKTNTIARSSFNADGRRWSPPATPPPTRSARPRPAPTSPPSRATPSRTSLSPG